MKMAYLPVLLSNELIKDPTESNLLINKRTIIMQRKSLLLAILLFSLSSVFAQDNSMQTFVSNLMGKMTLDEKIGQLNLPGAGDITTGQARSSDIAKKIAAGQVG